LKKSPVMQPGSFFTVFSKKTVFLINIFFGELKNSCFLRKKDVSFHLSSVDKALVRQCRISFPDRKL